MSQARDTNTRDATDCQNVKTKGKGELTSWQESEALLLLQGGALGACTFEFRHRLRTAPVRVGYVGPKASRRSDFLYESAQKGLHSALHEPSKGGATCLLLRVAR